MGANFRNTGDKGVITLDGDLTISNAEELRKVLMKSLLEAEDVSIEMENLQNMDLSCLQLLCSAHRSAVRFKKRLCIRGVRPGTFNDLVAAAGFARSSGCRLDTDKSCLWAAVQESGNDR